MGAGPAVDKFVPSLSRVRLSMGHRGARTRPRIPHCAPPGNPPSVASRRHSMRHGINRILSCSILLLALLLSAAAPQHPAIVHDRPSRAPLAGPLNLELSVEAQMARPLQCSDAPLPVRLGPALSLHT